MTSLRQFTFFDYILSQTMRIVSFLIFFAFCNVDFIDEFDFSEFTQIISLLLSATSLSEVLFEASMNDVLWDSTIDEFFNLLKW